MFRWFLCALFITAGASAQNEKENEPKSAATSVEITHKTEVYLDAGQTFGSNNKEGTAYVREAEIELGLKTQNAGELHTTILAEYDMSLPFLDAAYYTFDIKKDMVVCTGGYFYMPFGTLNSELISDLLIKGFVETPSAGAQIAGEMQSVNYAVALYNAVSSHKMEAGVARLGFKKSELIDAAASFRIEPSKNTDFDISLSSAPISLIKVTCEFCKGLVRGDSVNKPIGFCAELSIVPIEPVIGSVRYEQTSNGASDKTGDARIAFGGFYAVNQIVRVGAEFDLDKHTETGTTGDWNKTMYARLAMSIE